MDKGTYRNGRVGDMRRVDLLGKYQSYLGAGISLFDTGDFRDYDNPHILAGQEGVNMGWDGIGTAIGVVAEWLSPKKKIERMKDELGKLQIEKSELLIHKADVKSAKRMSYICKRIDELNRLLANAATA